MVVCLNVIVPVILIAALGYILRQRGKITDGFLKSGSMLAFSVGFPCNIVSSFCDMNFDEILNTRLLGLILAVEVLSSVLPMIIVPRFVKDGRIAASMVQSMFRANVLVQGITLLTNVYGEGNIAAGTFLLPFMVLCNNFMATLTFVFLVKDDSGKKGGAAVLNALKKILQNPLFISSLLGVLLSAFHITLPTMLKSTLSQIGKIASPLALICMGAELHFDTIRKGLRYTIPTVLVRLVVIPLCSTLAAIAMGFRGVELGSVYLFTSCCSATAGYVLASSMGGDPDIASQSICLSVLMSAFTVTAGLFILLQNNLI